MWPLFVRLNAMSCQFELDQSVRKCRQVVAKLPEVGNLRLLAIPSFGQVLKGSVTILSISLNSQNIYLCRGISENNGPFLLTIAVSVY